ncbi:hypothetical protein HK104_000887, partial [Borealophlyctis nickersoniae]
MTPTNAVGLVGLGAMGAGMAHNIHNHLKQTSKHLHIYNRTPEKAQPLTSIGATLHPTVASLTRECTVIFLMLFDDASTRSVLAEVLAAGPLPDTVVVNCATILPSTTDELVKDANAKQVQLVSAPVFGRPDAALARKLVVALAGDGKAKERVKPYLEAVSRKILDVGPNPRSASVLKLMGNFTIASLIEVSAEALSLGDKSGVDRSHYLSLLSELFPGPIWQGYAGRIANEDYVPSGPGGFTVKGGLKDLGCVKSVATETHTPMPLLDVLQTNMKKAEERGWANLDWGAMAKVVQEDAGVAGRAKKIAAAGIEDEEEAGDDEAADGEGVDPDVGSGDAVCGDEVADGDVFTVDVARDVVIEDDGLDDANVVVVELGKSVDDDDDEGGGFCGSGDTP